MSGSGGNLIGSFKKASLAKELVKKGCMVRKESALTALGTIDCVLLKIPWGGKPDSVESIADIVQQILAKGISIMLCFQGSAAEAIVVAEQLLGTESGATVVRCPSGEDWTSVVSHVANGATVSILAEISTQRIAQAVQALQEAGRIVLYYGFVDEEVGAIATAVVGFASGDASDAVKSASAVIAIYGNLDCLIAGIEACRSSAHCTCTVQ